MTLFDRLRRRLGRGGGPQPLACNELVEIITEYLEGTLPPSERARFDAHVDACDGCRAYVDQMRQTIRTVGRLSAEAVPAEAMESLLQTFRTWKRG